MNQIHQSVEREVVQAKMQRDTRGHWAFSVLVDHESKLSAPTMVAAGARIGPTEKLADLARSRSMSQRSA